MRQFNLQLDKRETFAMRAGIGFCHGIKRNQCPGPYMALLCRDLNHCNNCQRGVFEPDSNGIAAVMQGVGGHRSRACKYLRTETQEYVGSEY